MEKINLQGLTAYWDICQGKAGDMMQETLRDKYHFTQSLKELSHIIKDSQAFVQTFQQNIIGENIYIYDADGHMISLPEGATVIDLAYSRGKEIGDRLEGAFVNGQVVDVSTVLSTGDRVHLLLSKFSHGPKAEWESEAATVQAQKMMRKRRKKG